MITSGDKWTDEQEIADAYINNMGAVYGSDEEWRDEGRAAAGPCSTTRTPSYSPVRATPGAR